MAVQLGKPGIGSGVGGGGSSGGGGVATTKESVGLKEYGTTFEQLSISRSDNSQSAHGLSKTPDGIDAYLECTTADAGYSVGDRIDYAYTTRGLLFYDDTDVGWAGFSGRRPFITHKTSNAETEVGNNDWKAVARPFIYVDQDVVTDVSGGGGGSGTTLTPETGVQVYEADDEHNVVNVDGTLFEVKKRHTPGHSKVVALEQLTDTRFRGFFNRANEVLNPMHDQFMYLMGPGGVGGGYEKYNDSGGSTPTGFYPGYDPFAEGEPWHTAEVAAGIDYVGDFTYRGHVSTQADLERNATAAGEVYTVLDDRIVMFVDEFTAPLDGETVYHGTSLIPTYSNLPTLVLWGGGQTARYHPAIAADDIRGVFVTGGNIYLKWLLDDSELFFGATADMVGIVAAADAPADADGRTNITAADRGGIWMGFKAGIWTFSGAVLSDDADVTRYREPRLLRVASGQDALVGIGVSAPFGDAADGVGEPDFGVVQPFDSGLVRVAEGDRFYLVFGPNAHVTNSKVAQFMQCRYHGQG